MQSRAHLRPPRANPPGGAGLMTLSRSHLLHGKTVLSTFVQLRSWPYQSNVLDDSQMLQTVLSRHIVIPLP